MNAKNGAIIIKITGRAGMSRYVALMGWCGTYMKLLKLDAHIAVVLATLLYFSVEAPTHYKTRDIHFLIGNPCSEPIEGITNIMQYAYVLAGPCFRLYF